MPRSNSTEPARGEARVAVGIARPSYRSGQCDVESWREHAPAVRSPQTGVARVDVAGFDRHARLSTESAIDTQWADSFRNNVRREWSGAIHIKRMRRMPYR